VIEYSLSTGFDVSTASHTRNFYVYSQESYPTGIAFNGDGTKMFIIGSQGDDVNEYALTTGFDLGDVNYTQKFSVASQENAPTGMAFNGDGTKMFIIGSSGDDVNEYDLSTGFDLSTTITNKYILNGNYTLSSNLTIGAGEMLTIASGVTLTIPSGKTLTINGKLIENGNLISLVAKKQKIQKKRKISKINIALSTDLQGQLQYAGQPILSVIQFKNIENQMVKFVLLDNDPNDPFTQVYKGVVQNNALNATEKKDLYRHYAKMYDGSRDVLLYLESLSGEELVYRG
jgi:hypothetical protein